MSSEPEKMSEADAASAGAGDSGVPPTSGALPISVPEALADSADEATEMDDDVVGSDIANSDVEEAGDEAEVLEENISSEPLEYYPDAEEGDLDFKWYILKVAVNREDSIKAALLRRIKMNGLERYFADIVVPTEDVKEYTKAGKARVVKHKMYLGYLLVKMVINDETWFVVRETPGIGDFTGSGGKPTPMDQKDVDRILKISRPVEETVGQIKTNIPFKHGDRVRVKDGNFQNFEGDVDKIDEANGRVTVLVNIFGRSTPVELEHWQIESV